MSTIAKAISNGDHDDELRAIEHAVKYRQRVRMSSFKREQKVRVIGAGGRIDGCVATVIKPNQKTVTIMIDDTHETWRVSPQLLEAV